MKIKNKSSKKPLYIALAAVSLLVLLGLAWWYYQTNSVEQNTHNTDTDTVNYEEATEEQKADGEAIKDRVINESPAPSTDETDPLPSKDPDAPHPTSSNSGISNTLTALEVHDNILYVRNEIPGVYASGSCKLILKNGSQTVTKNAGVQALAKVTTCKGFNIPTSELSSGKWTVNLEVKINNETSSATGEVTV